MTENTKITFADLGLSDEIVKAVTESGYTIPTPIQEKAIPVVLMGRDVLGCAQTGTGKTASFTLPMIDILSSGRAKARMPRSLIIAPTRELAAQVADNFVKYGANSQLTMALLIGGVSFGDQETKLDRGVDVLIATPGRLLDHFERGKVLLNDVKVLVIDEADRMLDMGFIPDVDRIVSLLPTIRQTLFFSATMAPEIKRIADKYLMNPKEISVAPPASTAATVTQHFVRCTSKDKRDVLVKLIDHEKVESALIFCNRKRDIGVLHRFMKKGGYDVVELHGDMSQPARTATLKQFKDGEARLVICSDVAARGLDIKGLSHVFNFDVPSHSEDYVHRIGRTGRAGMLGRAFMLVTKEDSKSLAAITKLIGKPIPEITADGVLSGKELPPLDSVAAASPVSADAADSTDNADDAAPRKPSRSRGGRGRKKPVDAVTAEETVQADPEVAAPAVEAADTGPTERKPRRTRSRSKPRAAAETQTAETTAAPAKPEPAKTGNVEPFPEGGNRGSQRGGRDTDRNQDRNSDRGQDRGNRGRGGNNEDRGPRVQGFGDDIPAFMLRGSR
jgi:superfamily II DNA/RNA helicase